MNHILAHADDAGRVFAWDESLHPRVPAGDERGGEFVPGNVTRAKKASDLLRHGIEILYHRTTPKNAVKILEKGLLRGSLSDTDSWGNTAKGTELLRVLVRDMGDVPVSVHGRLGDLVVSPSAIERQSWVHPIPVSKVRNYALPRPLYVRRDVLNAEAIRTWAKSVGFDTVVPADEMHVTCAYSRTPVDWAAIPRDDDAPLTCDGPRLLEHLGDKGAIVLKFTSLKLTARHRIIREAGASWDYPTYTPHVTLTYANPDGLDPATIRPYGGVIELGPEVFEELDTDWSDKVVENEELGPGVWRTIRGRKVFIREGESLDSALARSLGDKKETGPVEGAHFSKDVNSVEMIHVTNHKKEILDKGFKFSSNSMYGEGVYFSSVPVSEKYGKEQVRVSLAPHKQLVLASDTDVSSAFSKLTGLSVAYLGSEKGRLGLVKAGVGSLRFPVDNEVYTVVLDPKLIQVKQDHVLAYADADGHVHEAFRDDNLYGKWVTIRGKPVYLRGGATMQQRKAHALRTHKPSTAAKQQVGRANEDRIARMLGVKPHGDNDPLDVSVTIGGRLHGVEVKTFTDNSNDKVTMHPESLARKEKWARKEKAALHTVVIDARRTFNDGAHRKDYSGHEIYYRAGAGSFRLAGMTPVRDAAHLRALVSGKVEYAFDPAQPRDWRGRWVDSVAIWEQHPETTLGDERIGGPPDHPEWGLSEKDEYTNYVNFGASLINSGLREKDPVTEALVGRMDGIVAKSPKLAEPIVAMRGIAAIPGERTHASRLQRIFGTADVKVGDTFSERAFLSTTVDRVIAEKFANRGHSGVLMEFVVPKGTPALKARSDEKEFIFARNTKFKVVEMTAAKPPRGDRGIIAPMLTIRAQVLE